MASAKLGKKRKRPRILYLDANIYLHFYSRRVSRLGELLPAIVSLKASIFVTKQIVHEVRRNRVAATAESYQQTRKKLTMSKTSLPEELDTHVGPSESWNLARRQVEQKADQGIVEFERIVSSILKEVTRGTDPVSRSFEQIFVAAREATDRETESARLRRELGNPPGKSLDPLGDQLSWEQLLSVYDGTQDLWIVTTDTDYFVSLNKERFLNAFLHEELRQRGGKEGTNLWVFDSLAQALDHFRNWTEKPMTLPPADVLEGIATRERQWRVWKELQASMAPTLEEIRTLHQALQPSILTTSEAIKQMLAPVVLSPETERTLEVLRATMEGRGRASAEPNDRKPSIPAKRGEDPKREKR